MNEVIEAKFEVVAERTPEIIAAEIKIIEAHVTKTVLSGAIEIGKKLEEVKGQVGHGNFENWCEENLSYSKSKAERFMKISSEYGKEGSLYFEAISKTSTLTDLSISNALKLLQVPEEEVEKFTEEHDVSSMKFKELEEEIKRLKEAKEETDLVLEDEREKANSEIEELEKRIKELEAEKEKAEQQEEQPPAEDNSKLIEDLDKMHDEVLSKQEEIEKLTAKLDKAKAKAKKLEEEKKSLQEGKEKELQTVKEKAMQEAMDAALEKAKEAMECALASEREKTESALQRAEQAEKNLENANSEIQMKRKVNMQLIQSLANELKAVIDTEPDTEKKKDMLAKSRGFISAMADIFKEA